MSRIWKQIITVPQGVKVEIQEQSVFVSGPKGALNYTLPQGVAVVLQDGSIQVSSTDVEFIHMRGLVRTLVSNMVVGVSQGFEKKLHIIGVWFSAKVQGKKLILNIGFSHPVEYDAPEGITFTAEKDPKGNDIVTINGFDKQLVGQVAASLRILRKPEPYKGKGIRYFGEKVRQKAGKTAGK